MSNVTPLHSRRQDRRPAPGPAETAPGCPFPSDPEWVLAWQCARIIEDTLRASELTALAQPAPF